MRTLKGAARGGGRGGGHARLAGRGWQLLLAGGGQGCHKRVLDAAWTLTHSRTHCAHRNACPPGSYVAELYSSFEDVACVYMVMEYCEGGDLFKTMLMHGGALEEQWVCVEVIAPLLRILEKMHTLKLLHRDIKPENIFLTALGKFKLGDFGLAIKFDEEIPFSRSGTLDYMAPEEGRSVDAPMLASRGVTAYGPPVDVWAAGVLAYELVVGRPPFEVEDEAQTAALIMYSDGVKYPPTKTPQWADFVRAALIKNPDSRPNATQLLQHPWCVRGRCGLGAGAGHVRADLWAGARALP
ncbi:MAG: kinase-like domain-containing protein [Monoraphidium minutum]|nr:MAG: kinase-like domain-containing protein [Monoraphidium minutum]